MQSFVSSFRKSLAGTDGRSVIQGGGHVCWSILEPPENGKIEVFENKANVNIKITFCPNKVCILLNVVAPYECSYHARLNQAKEQFLLTLRLNPVWRWNYFWIQKKRCILQSICTFVWSVQYLNIDLARSESCARERQTSLPCCHVATFGLSRTKYFLNLEPEQICFQIFTWDRSTFASVGSNQAGSWRLKWSRVTREKKMLFLQIFSIWGTWQFFWLKRLIKIQDGAVIQRGKFNLLRRGFMSMQSIYPEGSRVQLSCQLELQQLPQQMRSRPRSEAQILGRFPPGRMLGCFLPGRMLSFPAERDHLNFPPGQDQAMVGRSWRLLRFVCFQFHPLSSASFQLGQDLKRGSCLFEAEHPFFLDWWEMSWQSCSHWTLWQQKEWDLP